MVQLASKPVQQLMDEGYSKSVLRMVISIRLSDCLHKSYQFSDFSIRVTHKPAKKQCK